MKIEESPDVKKLAQEIISEWHKPLADLKIAYFFRAKAGKSGDKVVAGKCIRVDDRNWLLHGYDILIEIAKDVWSKAKPDFRRAIVDHELTHIYAELDAAGKIVRDADGRAQVALRERDVQEFAGILRRHGAYTDDLIRFLDAFQRRCEEQQELDLDDQEAEKDADATKVMISSPGMGSVETTVGAIHKAAKPARRHEATT